MSLLVTVTYKGKRELFRCSCLDVHPKVRAWLGQQDHSPYDTCVEFKRGVRIEDVLNVDLDSYTEEDFREDENLMVMVRKIW